MFNHEDELYGRHGLSYETKASVSGGTDQTKYYVSGLVKDDEGIAIKTGYKKQGVRVNLDQQMAPWLQLSANTNVTHSFSQRGLSNNDNSGTSPYLVFPFTPNFVDLQPINGGASRGRLPGQSVRAQQPAPDVHFPQERRGHLAGAGHPHRPRHADRARPTTPGRSSASAARTTSSRTTTWSRHPSSSSSRNGSAAGHGGAGQVVAI